MLTRKLPPVAYLGAHSRVRAQRGPATEHACEHCGKPARDWAYDGNDPEELIGRDPKAGGPLAYSLDPARYLPLCRSCHSRFDHPVPPPNRTRPLSHFRRAHGPLVHALRLLRGLTIGAAADSAQISHGYLSKIERSMRIAEVDVTSRLAVALDVETEVLTGQKPAIGFIRAALNIDPVVFARDVGLTPGRLDRIERGLDIPDTELRAVIARRLGVAVDALDPGAFAVA